MTLRRRLALIGGLASLVAAPPAAALAAPKDDDRPLRRPELLGVDEVGNGWVFTYDLPKGWVTIARVYGDGSGDRDLVRTVRSDEPDVGIPLRTFHHLTLRWVDRDSGRRSRLQRVDIDDLLGTLVDGLDDEDPDDQADAADD